MRSPTLGPVIVKSGAIGQLSPLLERYSSSLLIADERVHALHGQKLQCDEVLLIPAGEEAKQLPVLQKVWSKMQLDREGVVVALGGGSTTDLAGFAAATYMRGVALIHLPTTLLAMVDAAVGGKCGINYEGQKNRIGTLHPADAILSDLDFLETLPEREWRCGIAEMVKIGAVADRSLFEELEAGRDPGELIARAAQLKMEVVQSGNRDLLNFGHTIGHALESLTGMPHGEAISIGMAHKGGDRIAQLLRRFGLPTELPVPFETLRPVMEQDKKSRQGKIQFVVVEELGSGSLVSEENLIVIGAKK